MTSRPLDGVRVVSMAEQYPGPLATFHLAELGAEVIQMERPDGGDPQRALNPELFRAAGLNKKSIALNLKDARSRAAARALIGTADVLVEGFRPGVMARLGLAYDDLRAEMPALVYCSISGYGQTGADRDVVGHNINYEATVGALDPFIGGSAGAQYTTASLPLGDILGGMTAALGIVAAVHAVARTGRGRYLDIAISESLLVGLAPQLARAWTGAEVWTAREAGWGVFECRDGHVVLGIGHEDHFWQRLCDATRLERFRGLSHQERVDRAEHLRPQIQSVLVRETVQHWLDVLAPQGVPCSRARRLHEVLYAPELHDRGMFVTAADADGKTFQVVRSPLSRDNTSELTYRVPGLGEHTEELLAELGVSGENIQQIRRA